MHRPYSSEVDANLDSLVRLMHARHPLCPDLILRLPARKRSAKDSSLTVPISGKLGQIQEA